MQGQNFDNLLRQAGFVKTDVGKAASFLGLSRERIYQIIRETTKYPAPQVQIQKLEALAKELKADGGFSTLVRADDELPELEAAQNVLEGSEYEEFTPKRNA